MPYNVIYILGLLFSTLVDQVTSTYKYKSVPQFGIAKLVDTSPISSNFTVGFMQIPLYFVGLESNKHISGHPPVTS